MINKDKLKRRFSRGAKEYDKYAHVQKIMGDKLVSMTSNTNISSILEIGCGTGYVTRQICLKYPSATIDALDIAPGMIEHAKGKIKSPNVNFICGDCENISFEKKYDLIISNATFQWFNDFKNTVDKLYDLLTPKGHIIFSTFGEGTFYELRQAFTKASLKLKKEKISPSQIFLSKDELKEKLKRNIHIAESNQLEYFEDCNEFFLSLKKIGANNSSSNRKKVSPSFIQTVMDIYNTDYKINNKIHATYHCLWININKQQKKM